MKKILGSIGALTFALAIAACGSSSKKETTPPVPPAATADAGAPTGMEGTGTSSTPTAGNPCDPSAGSAGNPCTAPTTK